MKLWTSISLFLVVACASAFAQTNSLPGTSTNSLSQKMAASQKQLLEKYDLNHNGKIDVQERNGFVRERAHLIKKYSREEALSQTNLVTLRANRMKRNLSSVALDQDILAKYDLNKNGHLDNEELKTFQQDRIKQFRETQKELLSKSAVNSQGVLSGKPNNSKMDSVSKQKQ